MMGEVSYISDREFSPYPFIDFQSAGEFDELAVLLWLGRKSHCATAFGCLWSSADVFGCTVCVDGQFAQLSVSWGDFYHHARQMLANESVESFEADFEDGYVEVRDSIQMSFLTYASELSRDQLATLIYQSEALYHRQE